jgi:hypothetical protein
MKVKLRMFRIAVLVYVILVCGFAVRARACDCYPPCGDCKRCEAGVCVEDNDQDQTGGYTCNEPDVCGYCQKCSGGACVDDDAGGNTDEVCVGCKTCQSGTYEDDDDECDFCQKCSGGDCILKPTSECVTNSDCHELEHCFLCKCYCDNCYAYEYVPKNTLSPCPECDDEEGGCYSSSTLILSGYDRFTGGSPANGKIGLCGNPTKIELVGYHVFCTEYHADIDEIIEIVIGLGLDLSTYLDCGQCVLYRNPSACYMCIIGVIADELIDAIPCDWVEECEHCYLFDTNCSYPVEVEVVDWDKIIEDNIGLCYPGIDWP